MRKQELYIFIFSLTCNLEASFIILLAFVTLRAKQAMKKAASTEEAQLGSTDALGLKKYGFLH